MAGPCPPAPLDSGSVLSTTGPIYPTPTDPGRRAPAFVEFFLDRPIFAGVIAILITLAGLISVPLLPVSQFPPIAPPTV